MEYTKIILELTNEFSKFSGYKMYAPKSIEFVYTSSKQFEVKKNYKAEKRDRFVDIKDLYIENNKTLLKKLKN